MKTRTAPAGNRELKVTIEVEKATVDEALKAVAFSLAGRINIPGFRRSKVPYRVLERYVGRAALLAEAHEDLMQQALQHFLDQADITEPEHVELDEITDEPTSYAFTVSLEPYVDLPDDYYTLRIEPRELELTEQERAEEKAAVCDRLARLEEVASPIAWEDTVVLDIKGVVLDENQEPTDEMVLEDDEWEVALSEEYPLGPPNLEQEILGLTTGEEKQFVLTYPEDSESVYAGKSAQFDIRVLNVSRTVAAPWNAETIATVLDLDMEEEDRSQEEYETLFWQNMQSRKARSIFDEELAESLQLLQDASVVEYADASVENQIGLLVNQRLSGLAQFGIRNLETYLRYTNQSEAEFRESLREEAETDLVNKLLIWEFIKLENIQVPDDIQAQLHESSAMSARLLMESPPADMDENLTPDDVAAILSQQRMTEGLRHMGHNNLVEMYTDGVHSPNRYFVAMEGDLSDDAAPDAAPLAGEAVDEAASEPIEATTQAT